MVRFSEEAVRILAVKGGAQAKRVARQALNPARKEQVEDCAARVLAAMVGYPLEVRRKGLERALRMLRTR